MPIDRQAIPGLGVVTSTKVAFSTTDEQVEASAQGFTKVKVISITPLSAAGANDVLAVSETTDSNGVIDVPSTGTLTIDRPASGTSALPILVTMFGY